MSRRWVVGWTLACAFLTTAAVYARRTAGTRGFVLSRRRSGFSVHNRVLERPGDGREFEALVRYMSRSPVGLKRLRFAPGSKEVVYTADAWLLRLRAF